MNTAQTAFVTGATGFVGLNLVEQLVAHDWKVTALHRSTSELKPLREFGVSLVEGNMLDADSLCRALPESTSVVFHVAGDTSLWSGGDAQQTRVNVEGTRNIVEAALRIDVDRFIHTSSWNAYGLDHGDISEEMPKRGMDSWINYNRTKALAEKEVQKGIDRGLEAVIVNPSHIIGRYDRGNWARMIRMVHEDRLPGVPPGSGTFCHAEQVAHAHISAVTKGNVGENYLLGGADASFLEVIQEISSLTGRPVPDNVTSATLLKVVGHAQNWMAFFTREEPDLTPEGVAMVTSHPRVVSQKAERELDYRPVELRTMLGDSYDYLKQKEIIK